MILDLVIWGHTYLSGCCRPAEITAPEGLNQDQAPQIIACEMRQQPCNHRKF